MTTDTIAKKDTQKLQRAIVDGLEDVKAQDIQVFDTEHLSPLFERVIVASGTSNRQTKALAASVRDAVREAGFPKPRIEGETNGEWIIVDCAQVVVHIMQPNFRTYYNLEELWGEKPVRMKFGAAKPAIKMPVKAPVKTVAKKATGKKTAAKKAPARPLMPELAPESITRAPKPRPAAKGAVAKPVAKTTPVKPANKAPGAKAAVTRPAAAKAPAAKPAAARSASARSAKPASPAVAKAPARKPRASSKP
jgi:ribosome-associated protein